MDERGQVTVHLSFTADVMDGIRIRPSTCLICRSTGHRSPLVHAEGIPYAPTWLALPPGIARGGMDVYRAGLQRGRCCGS